MSTTTPTPTATAGHLDGLDNPHALALAAQLADLPLDARRHAAALAYRDRRAELELYALAYAERFGAHPTPVDLLDDDLLAELLVLSIA